MNIQILNGNYGSYKKEWNIKILKQFEHYNLYYIKSGGGEIIVNNNKYHLKPGHIYFISGYHINEYICNNFVEIYWIHFNHQSIYIDFCLTHSKPFYKFSTKELPSFDFKLIKDYFLFETSKFNKGICEEIYLNSMILTILSKVLNSSEVFKKKATMSDYLKLKPSLDFMETNYKEAINIKEISEKSFLNPIYFLRVFKRTFHITPHQYLIHKKLLEASKLLIKTDLNIETIAYDLNFCNQFYFSKIFKQKFNITPSKYRKTKVLP